PRFLEIDLQSRTDRNGYVHCWMCGRILPSIRRRTAHPTLLCAKPCYQRFRLETVRQAMRDLRMRRSIIAGRLPGPPLKTDLPTVLRGR
ncbi:MAG: hypothetical protein L3K19_09495, partial [Thermoplasmata archaeon]|nr:hypothetical protein [Thermoplasmata archaeon]